MGGGGGGVILWFPHSWDFFSAASALHLLGWSVPMVTVLIFLAHVRLHSLGVVTLFLVLTPSTVRFGPLYGSVSFLSPSLSFAVYF